MRGRARAGGEHDDDDDDEGGGRGRGSGGHHHHVEVNDTDAFDRSNRLPISAGEKVQAFRQETPPRTHRHLAVLGSVATKRRERKREQN